MAWGTGLNIISRHISIFLLAKLFSSFSGPANFKIKLVINDKISLRVVMNLMTMGELGDECCPASLKAKFRPDSRDIRFNVANSWPANKGKYADWSNFILINGCEKNIAQLSTCLIGIHLHCGTVCKPD